MHPKVFNKLTKCDCDSCVENQQVVPCATLFKHNFCRHRHTFVRALQPLLAKCRHGTEHSNRSVTNPDYPYFQLPGQVIVAETTAHAPVQESRTGRRQMNSGSDHVCLVAGIDLELRFADSVKLINTDRKPETCLSCKHEHNSVSFARTDKKVSSSFRQS